MGKDKGIDNMTTNPRAGRIDDIPTDYGAGKRVNMSTNSSKHSPSDVTAADIARIEAAGYTYAPFDEDAYEEKRISDRAQALKFMADNPNDEMTIAFIRESEFKSFDFTILSVIQVGCDPLDVAKIKTPTTSKEENRIVRILKSKYLV